MLLHPDCKNANINGEDSIIYNLHHLEKFIDDVHANNMGWGNKKEDLIAALEKGFRHYLTGPNPEDPLKAYVCKTPSPQNLELALQLLPQSKLVILVRDGKAVSESYQKTFNSRFDDSIRSWVVGAKSILHFLKVAPKDRYVYMRYEDLVQRPHEAMKKVLEYCQLPVDQFPFDKMSQMGVIGSSTFNDGKVTWETTKAVDEEFKPLERGANWPRLKKWRYYWLAGSYEENLGYKNKVQKGIAFVMYNVIMGAWDFGYRVGRHLILKVKLQKRSI